MEQTACRQFIELEESHFWFVGRRRIFFHLLDRELRGASDLRVLEVGCGAGGLLEPLTAYGTVVGLDISAELIGYCRERGEARTVVGSGYELPVPPGSLDLIALFDTIEHVPDDGRILAECRDALAPGGLLFVSVPAYQFLYANNDRVAHHYRRYTARRLRQTLADAGFGSARLTYFNTLLFPAILPTVLLKKARERRVDPGDTTNLSHVVPDRLNRALARAMSSERHILPHVRMPFGHSLIAMARRG